MAGSLSHVLITFDVDGTLVRSRGVDANKFHKVRMCLTTALRKR